MTGGDFSAEAYQQLRDAYAKQLNSTDDAEAAGREVMGQQLPLETMKVDSPWADKVNPWTYPNGKSEYIDGKQSPDEILAIMRDAAQERIDADKVEEAKELVAEAEEVEVEEEEMSDEELDELVRSVLSDEDDVEEDEDEEEDEEERGDEGLDPEALKAQIEELKAQLAAMDEDDLIDAVLEDTDDSVDEDDDEDDDLIEETVEETEDAPEEVEDAPEEVEDSLDEDLIEETEEHDE